MMLITVLEFGSNWWARFGRDPQDRYRYTRHAAYFNSAGVQCGSKIRRHWVVPGLIRFNGVGDFNPQFPSRSVGRTFECTDLTFALGGNRILFRKKVAQSGLPDFFLLAVSSDTHGGFDFEDSDWKARSVTPIAISHLREKQEALVLMRAGDWVRSALGVWQLKVSHRLPHGAALELLEDGILDPRGTGYALHQK
jgi:hypothetical protein